MPIDLRPLGQISWRATHVWRRNLLRCVAAWRTSLLPPLVEPVLYLLAFGVVLGPVVGSVTEDGARASYLAFVAPGLVAVGVALRATRETLYGSFSRLRDEGTIEAMLATPLSVEDVVAGEILWGTTQSLLTAGAMLGAIWLSGAGVWPSSWWAVPVSALSGFVFASAGMCFAAACPTADSLGVPMFLVMLPMCLFSGTFFPLDALPAWAARLAWALPLTHAASLMRAVMLGRPPSHLVGSLAFLGGVSVLLFVAALALMRRRLVR